MQRRIIDLTCIFGPLVSDWHINVRGRSAGDGVTGAGQVIMGNQPRWEASLNLAGFTRDQVLTWRAIKASMRGRVNIVRVCVCDMYRPTFRQNGITPPPSNGIPHSDNALHSDNAGYSQEFTVRMTETILAGATEMTVDASNAADAMTAGQFFAHNDWLYQITGIYDAGGGMTRYTFEPPLRRDIPAGDEIYSQATALMAFTEDLDGRLPLDLGKRGVASINLVEWVNRP